MKIIPSIDLQNNRCVRLRKGDFNEVTYYDRDPCEIVKKYEEAGVDRIHIVDLDGAKNRTISQLSTIIKMKKSTTMKIQVGGGIRTEQTIQQLLDAHIDKIVLGSLAITDPQQVITFMNQFGAHHFVLAFDVNIDQKKIPKVAIHGWQQESTKILWDALDAYNNENVSDILCTDIEQDGMLQGPNFSLYKECVEKYPQKNFQASGGVRHIEDLKNLQKIGVSSVIVGKALLEEQFNIAHALKEIKQC